MCFCFFVFCFLSLFLGSLLSLSPCCPLPGLSPPVPRPLPSLPLLGFSVLLSLSWRFCTTDSVSPAPSTALPNPASRPSTPTKYWPLSYCSVSPLPCGVSHGAHGSAVVKRGAGGGPAGVTQTSSKQSKASVCVSDGGKRQSSAWLGLQLGRLAQLWGVGPPDLPGQTLSHLEFASSWELVASALGPGLREWEQQGLCSGLTRLAVQAWCSGTDRAQGGPGLVVAWFCRPQACVRPRGGEDKGLA